MATRTDLGKIIITNGGEYNPDTAYEKNTFVLYRNSTYLALQTVTGVEPVDDRVNWQLMAKGFAGSETQIEGYVFVDNEEVIVPEADPALDADKLGGNLPEYYAPQHEISDSYSDAKSYVVGDYCIYLNALYRFTKAKAAGAWDGTAVVPVTLAQEIKANNQGIAALNSQFTLGSSATEFLAGSNNNDLEFLRVRTSSNQYHQLIADANGLRLDSINGSTNTTRWRAALERNVVPGKALHLPNSCTKITLTNFSTNYPVMFLFGVRSKIILGAIAFMGIGQTGARIEKHDIGAETFSVEFSNSDRTGITITFNDRYAQITLLCEASYDYTFS